MIPHKEGNLVDGLLVIVKPLHYFPGNIFTDIVMLVHGAGLFVDIGLANVVQKPCQPENEPWRGLRCCMQTMIEYIVAVMGRLLLQSPALCKLRQNDIDSANSIQQLQRTENLIGGAFAVPNIADEELIELGGNAFGGDALKISGKLFRCIKGVGIDIKAKLARKTDKPQYP